MKIVITKNEETSLCIHVEECPPVLLRLGDVTTTPVSWYRTCLLHNVRDTKIKSYLSLKMKKLVTTLVADDNLLQVIYDNGDTSFVKYTDITPVEDDYSEYGDMACDVSHIYQDHDHWISSRKVGINEDTPVGVLFGRYNLITIHSTFVYIGYDPHDEYVTCNVNKYCNKVCFGMEGEIDDGPIVVIIHPLSVVGEVYDFISANLSRIECVICDTRDIYLKKNTSTHFLSFLNINGIIVLRSLYIHNVYNFGTKLITGDKSPPTTGVVNMTMEEITNASYIMNFDSRYALISLSLLILNNRKGIDVIVLKHDIDDGHVAALTNYRVNPMDHKKQLNDIALLFSGGLINTSVVVETKYPMVAKMFTTMSMYATNKDSTKYVNKIMDALDNPYGIIEDMLRLSIQTT